MQKTITIQKLRLKNNQTSKGKYRKPIKTAEKHAGGVTAKKPEILKRPQKLSKADKKTFIPSIDPYDKPLKWWEKEHIKYAMNYPPVKTKLERIMGTHIVRFTDHGFMTLLGSKIRKYYEEQQRERIEKRKIPTPTVMSELLKVSYKRLSDTMNKPGYERIKLYM